MTAAAKRMSGWVKWLAALLIVAGLIVAGRALPVAAWLQQFNAWVAGLGWWAPATYAAAYAVATVLLMPGSALSLGGGAIFGVLQGVVVVWSGAMVGAAGSFLIARHGARGAVSRRLAGSEKFAAIDRAVAREGGRIVFLLRLSPIFPFNALNYLLGLTAVSFRSYLAATAIGMLPGSLLYVYLGYATRAGVEAAAGNAGDLDVWRYALIGVGLVATLAVTIHVTRLARRALQEVTRTG